MKQQQAEGLAPLKPAGPPAQEGSASFGALRWGMGGKGAPGAYHFPMRLGSMRRGKEKGR